MNTPNFPIKFRLLAALIGRHLHAIPQAAKAKPQPTNAPAEIPRRIVTAGTSRWSQLSHHCGALRSTTLHYKQLRIKKATLKTPYNSLWNTAAQTNKHLQTTNTYNKQIYRKSIFPQLFSYLFSVAENSIVYYFNNFLINLQHTIYNTFTPFTTTT